MKLRILDSSLRLRLDRSELRQLVSDGCVERRIEFGGCALTYALHAVAQAAVIRAMLGPSRIDVYVDASRAAAWANSDEASLKAVQPTGDGELRLLLEKDFPCQHSGSDSLPEKFTPRSMRVDADTKEREASKFPLGG